MECFSYSREGLLRSDVPGGSLRMVGMVGRNHSRVVAMAEDSLNSLEDYDRAQYLDMLMNQSRQDSRVLLLWRWVALWGSVVLRRGRAVIWLGWWIASMLLSLTRKERHDREEWLTVGVYRWLHGGLGSRGGFGLTVA